MKTQTTNNYSLEVAHDTDLVHKTMATQSEITAQNGTKVGLVIISVLLPIVGYVMYFSKKDEEPEAARNYLYSALVGSVVGVLLMV